MFYFFVMDKLEIKNFIYNLGFLCSIFAFSCEDECKQTVSETPSIPSRIDVRHEKHKIKDLDALRLYLENDANLEDIAFMRKYAKENLGISDFMNKIIEIQRPDNTFDWEKLDVSQLYTIAQKLSGQDDPYQTSIKFKVNDAETLNLVDILKKRDDDIKKIFDLHNDEKFKASRRQSLAKYLHSFFKFALKSNAYIWREVGRKIMENFDQIAILGEGKSFDLDLDYENNHNTYKLMPKYLEGKAEIDGNYIFFDGKKVSEFTEYEGITTSSKFDNLKSSTTPVKGHFKLDDLKIEKTQSLDGKDAYKLSGTLDVVAVT